MQLRIPAFQWKQITAALETAFPREGCGLLGGRRRTEVIEVVEVLPAPNAWEGTGQQGSRRNRFHIAPDFHRRVHTQLKKRGLEIVGVFHSHPDAPPQPSARDRRLAWPELLYCIVEVVNGQVKEAAVWQPPRLSRQAVLKIT